ncbi:VOC family protein [Oceanibium sediminis]|uniref:VOC family protein n=1 Tax=Oceanibium sediminis TaxID=2026339 RepID=UPI000DD2B8C7|nr:VOC family protein [Oceanibium sediminis]
MLSLDHIVFACRELSAGAAWMEQQLGQPPVGGGQHPMMGTHNKLWRLEGAYLEVIAIDPGASDPGRKRWFALDDPAMQARLRGAPQLVTWVARSDDLDGDIARAPLDPGPVLRLTRDRLCWDLTVREDGALHWGGVFPGLIQWPQGVASPAESLPDQGLRLAAFTAHGPEGMRQNLRQLGVGHILRAGRTTGAPALSALIERADGRAVAFD